MNKELLKENISNSITDILRKYNINDINISNMIMSINECIDNHIFEGIDVDVKDKIVAFNPNHQEYVDTNDPWNPTPIYNNVEGYKVISIFKRKDTENKIDGNPLIYALKNMKGWKFKNPSYDIFALLRRFVAVTKELKENFDVIITTPSSNRLNTEILYKISRLIKHEVSYKKFFCKYDADVVYETMIDFNWIDREYPTDAKNIHENVYNAICRMMRSKEDGGNDGTFSYKYINKAYRKYIIKSMYINDYFTNEEEYANTINGKKILVIDDTVTSGKTISDSAEAILDTYAPESITFLTLFSPLMKD